MAGAAITIALQQLKGFLGIVHFTKKSWVVDSVELADDVGRSVLLGISSGHQVYCKIKYCMLHNFILVVLDYL